MRGHNTGGIISFLCTTVHEAPLFVHKKPHRIGPWLGELLRILLSSTSVNKGKWKSRSYDARPFLLRLCGYLGAI